MAESKTEKNKPISPGTESNVSETEKELLHKAATTMDNTEEERLKQALPDNRDEDGELLNEQVGLSGNDLDIPGSEEDDESEESGSEDEENNFYSLGGPEKTD